MNSIFNSNNFLRKTYTDDIFNAYILPWNCHISLDKPQNYSYTHRYKAVLGFDFSYVIKGARFPEYENTGVAGIGFFSTYGETSWVILDSTDGRVDIRGAAREVLPMKYSDNRRAFHYYNGIYYNLQNSIADQINNRMPHYMHNVVKSLVNSDRGELAYLEQTYWKHATPGHWDKVTWSYGMPGILSVKPCTRADWFIEFFKPERHWINKLNFLSISDSDYTHSASSIYGKKSKNNKLFLFAYYFMNKCTHRMAWKFKAARKATKVPFLKKRYRLLTNWAYSKLIPESANRDTVMRRLKAFCSRMKGREDFKFFNAVRSLRTFIRLRKFRKTRRRLHKKLKIRSRIKKKVTSLRRFYYTPRANEDLYYLSLKSSLNFLSWRYSKKKKYNLRMWYREGPSSFRNPRAVKKAIRYAKITKKRKYIFVF